MYIWHSQLSRSAAGIVLGVVAATGWGAYIAATRHALGHGLEATDLTFIRFLTSGIILGPWLLFATRARLSRLSWTKALTLTVLVGPPMVVAVVGGNSLVPFASGVSIELAALAFGSILLARLALNERLDSFRLIGLTLIGGRIALLATPAIVSGSTEAWGVLLFIAAGAMCAGYGALVRFWQIPPVTAVGVVATVSLVIYGPYYLLVEGTCRLLEAPWSLLIEQIVAQGLIAGTTSLIAFSMSVRLLGVATAGTLPMLTPLIAGGATWFLTGEYQSFCGWAVLTASAFGAAALILDVPAYLFRSRRA